MKKLFFALLFGVMLFQAQAQDKKEQKDVYTFTTVKENPYTPVKNQSHSSTCWSFSTVAFLESELLRTGKGEYDLSDMFYVYYDYMQKMEQYVRFHGTINFGAGGGSRDVTQILKQYGAVPESVYAGLNYGEPKHNHDEMDKILKEYAQIIASSKKPSTAWKTVEASILDSYLGKIPTEFEYKGKKYTPKTFGQSLGLNPDDYVEIGSYMHHPYYSQFILEIEDNWRFDKIYNVQLDEMIKIIDDAINSGYTVAWGSDVSEKGFSWKNGVAVVPDMDRQDLSGTDMDRWTKMSEKDKEAQLFSFDKPLKEKTITPEMRQQAFDNFETTDDHGMLIYGIAKDQNGNKYYMVKNSWGTDSKYKGIFYASEAFVKYKTTSIMVNKNVISADLKKKLGL